MNIDDKYKNKTLNNSLELYHTLIDNGTLQKDDKTNEYSISKKKGMIKIKSKSVIRKTGNSFLDLFCQ